MKWEKPSFVEICMNAEIGGYQGDDGDRWDVPAQAGREGTAPPVEGAEEKAAGADRC
jgi:hypothetical protein